MLRFPYLSEPIGRGGGASRWRPLVPVRIFGPTQRKCWFPRALIDTGADDTIFPMHAATLAGVRLRPPAASVVRWHGQAYPIQFGDVELELRDGRTALRWPAIIAFSVAPLRYPLLGQRGCLQYLDATFLGDAQLVELVANRSLPGIASQP